MDARNVRLCPRGQLVCPTCEGPFRNDFLQAAPYSAAGLVVLPCRNKLEVRERGALRHRRCGQWVLIAVKRPRIHQDALPTCATIAIGKAEAYTPSGKLRNRRLIRIVQSCGVDSAEIAPADLERVVAFVDQQIEQPVPSVRLPPSLIDRLGPDGSLRLIRLVLERLAADQREKLERLRSRRRELRRSIRAQP